MLKVLHITSDYSRQSLYKRLFEALSFKVKQNVFVPVRTSWEINSYPSTKFSLSIKHILNKSDKVFFRRKINKIVSNVPKSFHDVDLIHAHFLYSDGASALKLHKKFGIPYIVTVRNADVNKFMKLRPDLAILRNAILKNASKIIFLNRVFYKKIIMHLPKDYLKEFDNKVEFIPNGISEDWFNTKPNLIKNNKSITVLYVGDLSKNKNIRHTVSAVENLNNSLQDIPVKLIIVGEKGSQKDIKFYEKHPLVEYKGRIDNLNDLKDLYASANVFCMPSIHETFGLVYIESLSQGTPVIYTKGQAIDGLIDDTRIALSVSGNDVNETCKAIKSLSLYPEPSLCIETAKRYFQLSNVVDKHFKIYNGILT